MFPLLSFIRICFCGVLFWVLVYSSESYNEVSVKGHCGLEFPYTRFFFKLSVYSLGGITVLLDLDMNKNLFY